MTKSIIIPKIAQFAKDILMEWKEDDKEFQTLVTSDKSMSWVWTSDNDKEIKEEEIIEYLEKWAKESIKEQGRVLLYVCPDNALISFDSATPKEMREITDGESFNPFEKEQGFSNKLWIGWD